MTHKKSISLFKQGSTFLVGGVNSPVRSFNAVGGNPLVMDHGRGSVFVDVDGNRYTDYCLSWGALLLGHAHPAVTKAVKQSISKGSSFGTTTKPEIDLAQMIVKHVPSVDQVRFVNSGTEATMSAIRLARGFTKRPMVVKFDGCYHGHADDLLACAGSGVALIPASSSEGIPADHLKNTISLPFNDVTALEGAVERHHEKIACMILEPVPGNMGVILPKLEFLKSLRALTKKYGIVLIFDEVMSGFRSNLGGVQADLGIIPDMTCMGKIIGGGYPVGAYGGRRDIMSHLAPLGRVYQAGTFAGNPLVMSAGLAVLSSMGKADYLALNKRVDHYVKVTNKIWEAQALSLRLVNYKSMVSVRFTSKPVEDYAQAQAVSQDSTYAKLFRYLLEQGVYWPPANLETFFVSVAHSEKDLSRLTGILAKFRV